MKTITPYITAIKKQYDIKDDKDITCLFGIDKPCLKAIKSGKGVDCKNCIRIAAALDIDPVEVFAISKAIKTKNKEQKELWYGLAYQLRIVSRGKSQLSLH